MAVLVHEPVLQSALRLGFAVALGLCSCAGGEAQTIDEYEVKAAFLFNFSKFVEWPAQAFKNSTDPMSICVLGANPFGLSLDEAVSGKSVDGRKFAVRQFTEPSQADGCQILFFATPQKKLPPDVAWVGVLTVGESAGFAAAGGVIGFKLEGGRVRLEVNVHAAQLRGLRISSKLLSLAQIVKSRGM